MSNDEKLNLQEIAGETATQTVVAPVEETTTGKKAHGRKKGSKNVAKTEEAVTTPPVQVIEPTLQTVSLHDFMEAHKDKIVNRVKINVNIPTIPDGKYDLYVTDTDRDADLFLLDGPNTLMLEEFVPDAIKIEKSGVVISSATRRAYATKTNVLQFDLNSAGIPTLCRTIKRPNAKGEVGFSDEVKQNNTHDLDQIKIIIKTVASPLSPKINEMTNIDDIKNSVMEFYTEVRDLNYLIKIEKQILMTCFN